jgi:hypothetical protein
VKYTALIKQIEAWKCQGVNLSDRRQLIHVNNENGDLEKLLEFNESLESAKEGLPGICVTNRPLQDKTSDALVAIKKVNNPPHLFRHGGGLDRVTLT